MQYYSNMPYMSYLSPWMEMPRQEMVLQPMPYAVIQDIYSYPQNLPGALQLITEAIGGEKEDRLFYDYLITEASCEEDKKIISGIRDNEITHFGHFRHLYFELTGQMPASVNGEEFQKPASYCEGLKKALIGEQHAVEKYRKILFALQDRRQINILTEIITDEIRHAALYNYLFSKNGCRD